MKNNAVKATISSRIQWWVITEYLIYIPSKLSLLHSDKMQT